MFTVSGCCIVKDALRYDFPVVEAIKSVQPLCDEFIVGVGKSDDGTLDLVKRIPGIRVFESEWDENLRKGGQILSVETNKAISRCNGDWIFYIQADEVVHEKTLPAIKESMRMHFEFHQVEGLLFDYMHFYGSYSVYQRSHAWYPHEVRIIRGHRRISSHGDAKGFRIAGRKLRVAPSGGIIHHYGWVREAGKMLEKRKSFYRFWHDDGFIEKEFGGMKEYSFWGDLSTLGVFEGTHPAVMEERIGRSKLSGYPEGLNKRSRLKDFRVSVTNSLYRLGIRGSKNYILLPYS